MVLLFSYWVVCDSLQPHGLQHARLPCPALSPGVCSNSCPLSWWCYPAISSSAAPFSFCLQSFLASGSFLISQLFASGSQTIGASASVLPMNVQGWLPLGLTGLISLQSKGLSIVFSSTTFWKHQFFNAQPSFQLSHPYMTTGKTIALTRWTFVSKVMSLLFNVLSRLVTAFLPKSKHLLISWLPSAPSGAPQNKVSHCFKCFPTYLPWMMGLDAVISVFLMLNFKPAFSLSSFTLIKRLISSPSASAIRVVLSAYLRLLIFLPVILIPTAWYFAKCTLHIS